MENVMVASGSIIHVFLYIYMWVVIIGALISWVNPNPFNPVVRFLKRATEPVFRWFRSRLPLRVGGIDFSPVVVIAAIIFVDVAVAGSLVENGNVMANILLGFGRVIHIMLTLYLWIVIISAVISWVSPDPYNPIVRFFYSATEPAFAWFRRRIPLNFGGIDFSPVLIIAIILLVDMVVAREIMQLSFSMKMRGGFF